MIGKLKDSAAFSHCSGEGREKREGECLCGGNQHEISVMCERGKKKVMTQSCKGILHLHRYDRQWFLCCFTNFASIKQLLVYL